MSLSHYMAMCLTYPKGGYYTGEQEVFGCRGDFITSPEISQLFSEVSDGTS